MSAFHPDDARTFRRGVIALALIYAACVDPLMAPCFGVQTACVWVALALLAAWPGTLHWTTLERFLADVWMHLGNMASWVVLVCNVATAVFSLRLLWRS